MLYFRVMFSGCINRKTIKEQPLIFAGPETFLLGSYTYIWVRGALPGGTGLS